MGIKDALKKSAIDRCKEWLGIFLSSTGFIFITIGALLIVNAFLKLFNREIFETSGAVTAGFAGYIFIFGLFCILTGLFLRSKAINLKSILIEILLVFNTMLLGLWSVRLYYADVDRAEKIVNIIIWLVFLAVEPFLIAKQRKTSAISQTSS